MSCAVMVQFLAGAKKCPDWLWGPPSFLLSAYQATFLLGEGGAARA